MSPKTRKTGVNLHRLAYSAVVLAIVAVAAPSFLPLAFRHLLTGIP